MTGTETMTTRTHRTLAQFVRLFSLIAMAVVLTGASLSAADYCSLKQKLADAKDAVANAQKNLNNQGKRPASLGSLIAAKATLRVRVAEYKSALESRNTVAVQLNTYRAYSAGILKKNSDELNKAPSITSLQADIQSVDFLLKNRTATQKKKHAKLLGERFHLKVRQNRLNEATAELAKLEDSLTAKKLTRLQRVEIDKKIAAVKQKIAARKTLVTEKQKEVSKLEEEVFPNAENRRLIQQLPALRQLLKRKQALQDENVKLKAAGAKLEATLSEAETKLKTAKTKQDDITKRIADITRRNREIAAWDLKNQNLNDKLKAAKSALKTQQTLFDSAVRMKNLTLASVKMSAGLSTINKRNLDFQQKTKKKVREFVNTNKAAWEKKIAARKYDRKTRVLLEEKLAIYYKHVYTRERDEAIVRQYKKNLQLLKSNLKTLQPFDCDTFADVQDYIKGLNKWIGLFDKWSKTRAERAKKTDQLAMKSAADFNRLWTKPLQPKVGLSDVVVSTNRVTIELWDHGKQDGDEVMLYVNDKPIGRIQLKNSKQRTRLSLNLADGVHTLTVKALNQGTSGPNTASISISNVTKGKSSQRWNLKTSQQTSMKIHVIRR
ncbi:MAG: hypothetical protein Tsb009_12760 [Planctomycetaceae bacterium]